MSNNSQDEPNEYEIIFDGTTSNSSANTKIEVSDAEPEEVVQTDSPSEYIDAEVDSDINDADGFMKNHQSDAEDGDIEDGIFAPVRKPKTVGKRTASLMWAVSLLAFVGVGAFVYVSNPDIVSKVTSNLGSGGDVTLPSDATTADAGAVVPDATADVSVTDPVGEIEPTIQASDTTEAIKPDVIAQDTSTTDVTAPTPDAAPTNIAAVPTETLVTVSTPTPSAAPTSAAVPPLAAAAPVPNLLSAEPKPVEAKLTDINPPVSTVPSEKTAAVTSTPDTVATPTPVAPKADVSITVATPAANSVPASSPSLTAIPSDVITPTNDKDDYAEEGFNNDATPTATIATAPAIAPSVVPPVAEVKKADTSVPKKENSEATENKPIIVASKEEKKVLDDARLDKYFDSPSGKMLKNIPAPSMDPKKGSRESIIIVNKNGKKASTDYTKPAGPIAIETTSLSAQMVSANRAMKLGRYDAAKEMYDDLYKLNPRDVQILSGRAVLMQKMGFNDQAISAYEELLKVDPDNTDAIVNLSGLIRKQYPAVALSKLLDLHMNHPDNVAVTAQLGVAYADSGNFPDAMRYLGDAAAMDPKNPQHFYNMAVVSEKAKKPDQAISYYEKALEVDSIYGEGQKTVSKEKIYDRLAQLRGN